MCPELRDNPPTIKFLKKYIPATEFKFQALAGDASARRYVRVYDQSGSYILMIFPTDEQAMAENFLAIRHLFESYEIFVPKLIGHDFALGYILLEDLGDLTLERRFWENQEKHRSIPFYVKAIDQIIKIHHIPINKDDLTPCFQMQFDTEKLLWEMNYMFKNLIVDFFKIEIKDEFKKQLVNDFTSICSHLSSLPQVVCHRDYHSRNIMLHKNETFIIDFQDARLGPCQYDIVSLLRDSYVQIEPSMEEELLRYYHKKTQSLHQEDWDAFFNNYKIQTLQRSLKACGSFSSFFNANQDRRYLKYIQPTLRQIERVLFSIPDYAAIKELFSVHKIGERSCQI